MSQRNSTPRLSLQAQPHMEKSEVVDNETGKSQPSELVYTPCLLQQLTHDRMRDSHQTLLDSISPGALANLCS